VWEVRGEWLGRLRAEFPEWGFLFDPFAGVWVGVRGRWRTEVAVTGIELYERLKAQRPKKGGDSEWAGTVKATATGRRQRTATSRRVDVGEPAARTTIRATAREVSER
jgi:hypothetical protein